VKKKLPEKKHVHGSLVSFAFISYYESSGSLTMITVHAAFVQKAKTMFQAVQVFSLTPSDCLAYVRTGFSPCR
jgi:hypothetical protein